MHFAMMPSVGDEVRMVILYNTIYVMLFDATN